MKPEELQVITGEELTLPEELSPFDELTKQIIPRNLAYRILRDNSIPLWNLTPWDWTDLNNRPSQEEIITFFQNPENIGRAMNFLLEETLGEDFRKNGGEAVIQAERRENGLHAILNVTDPNGRGELAMHNVSWLRCFLGTVPLEINPDPRAAKSESKLRIDDKTGREEIVYISAPGFEKLDFMGCSIVISELNRQIVVSHNAGYTEILGARDSDITFTNRDRIGGVSIRDVIGGRVRASDCYMSIERAKGSNIILTDSEVSIAEYEGSESEIRAHGHEYNQNVSIESMRGDTRIRLSGVSMCHIEHASEFLLHIDRNTDNDYPLDGSAMYDQEILLHTNTVVGEVSGPPSTITLGMTDREVEGVNARLVAATEENEASILIVRANELKQLREIPGFDGRHSLLVTKLDHLQSDQDNNTHNMEPWVAFMDGRLARAGFYYDDFEPWLQHVELSDIGHI